MINQMVTAQEFKHVIEELIDAKARLGINFTTTIETDYASRIYKDPVFRKEYLALQAGKERTWTTMQLPVSSRYMAVPTAPHQILVQIRR